MSCMFWPSIWSHHPEPKDTTMSQRKLKEELILRAYNLNDKARSLASANQLYMGSAATAQLFAALGSDWPKVSLFNAMEKATDQQIDAALVICEPYLKHVAADLGKPTDDTRHQISWDFSNNRAKALGPGVTLYTRDGSDIGNAIIVKQIEPDPAAFRLTDYLTQTGQKFWLVETDFGNTTRLSDNEIHEMWNIGVQHTYEEWASNRRDLAMRGIQP